MLTGTAREQRREARAGGIAVKVIAWALEFMRDDEARGVATMVVRAAGKGQR